MEKSNINIVVFSSLFPSEVRPTAGIFIRERMFRVAAKMPLTVVSPVPWFPFQALVRRYRPHFRPMPSRHEIQDGIDVYYPRYFSIPGFVKFLDGFFMALGSFATLRKLRNEERCDLIDSHFAFPDGKAATLLGKWLQRPVTITLRGTEVSHSKERLKRLLLVEALGDATRIFSVSTSLKKLAEGLGIESGKIRVIGNGVDADKFQAIDRQAAREQLGLPVDSEVLLTIGALVERKGFHRVIELMPSLLSQGKVIHYLIVGGAGPEGDWTEHLKQMVSELGLTGHVHFLGTLPPTELYLPLSAADVFVLSTRNEGWANVLLEALACGVPVVASDVGGNSEVIASEDLGFIVPFGDRNALERSIVKALARNWDRERIVGYARENSWESRVVILVKEFTEIVGRGGQ
ncbi:MAG: glycosyl transferase family 1 [Thiotrichales bacterium SG8_50]|nr:MAG: glycosyl transferase family 1 [Thiotrichales bacterium SG8_50]